MRDERDNSLRTYERAKCEQSQSSPPRESSEQRQSRLPLMDGYSPLQM